MIDFNDQDFQRLEFSKEQLEKYLNSAQHDLAIAAGSDVEDVIFRFSCDALLKIGIYLIAKAGYKVRSRLGHHHKILEKTAQILRDENISILGNKMRQDRNVGLYAGGISVTRKECLEYLAFVKETFEKATRPRR